MKTIQYRFNLLKSRIKLFLTKLKYFRSFFIKKMFKRKLLFSAIEIWILATTTITLAAAITAHTSINRSQSIAELIYNNKNSKDTLGFLTSFETSNNTYTLCSVQPEKSAKFRNINDSAEFYDCYPANYLNTTPATVNYINEEKKDISFVLIPKENYTNSYFSAPHSFKLLVGGTSSSSNPEDIYINEDYAKKLMFDDASITSYTQLLNKRIVLPYSNNYVKNIDMNYVIKGVIDGNDPKYNRYKSFVGDFFLANQYLNLPINGTALFEIPKKLDEIRELLDSLFKIYDYDTIGRYFDALSFTMAYEYRIYGVEGIGQNQNDIYKVNDESNVLFNKYNSVYNYYFQKSYIVPIIIIFIIILALLTTFVVLLKSICNVDNLKTISVAIILSILMAFPTAIGTNRLYKALFLRGVSVSISSWQTFVFMAIALILLLTIWFIYQRIIRSNKKSCQYQQQS